jgi:hypothetical protein
MPVGPDQHFPPTEKPRIQPPEPSPSASLSFLLVHRLRFDFRCSYRRTIAYLR